MLSPPFPIDTNSELSIPPGTNPFPDSPRPVMAAPSTPVAAAKKRKRAAATVVSPGSPRTVGSGGSGSGGSVRPLERPPLSPGRTHLGYGGASPLPRIVRAKCSSSRSPQERRRRQQPPLRQHDVLFEMSPWTDDRACALLPPPQPWSHPPQLLPTVPDLWTPDSRRPALVGAPVAGGTTCVVAAALSPLERNVEGISTRRASDLLAPPRIEEEEEEDRDMNMEDGEEDLVGLKFVSFDEGENVRGESSFCY